jgi:hypothetical protein
LSLFLIPVAQADPAAWWPLDEAAGSMAADASGNGISANMTDVTWAPGSGRMDGAAEFDGQQTRGEFALPAWDVLAFAVWVNFSGNGDSKFPRLLDAENIRFGVIRGASGEPDRALFVATEHTGGTVDYRTAAAVVPAAGWVHLAMIYDRQADRSFQGWMDDARLYIRKVTLPEIRSLAGLPPPVGETSLEDFASVRPGRVGPRDFDGDGLPDLAERALGFDPTTPGEVNPFVGWDFQHSPPRLLYRRATDDQRYGVQVLSSEDLQLWSAEQVDQELSVEPVDGETVEVAAGIGEAANPLFARIQVLDKHQLEELDFDSTRDLFAKMAVFWQSQVNTAGTADPAGGEYDYEWVMRMVFPLAAWLS